MKFIKVDGEWGTHRNDNYIDHNHSLRDWDGGVSISNKNIIITYKYEKRLI